MSRYTDIYVSKTYYYTVGYDNELKSYFLSIMVSNRKVDYDEYYYIDYEQCKIFASDQEKGRLFANECRQHKHDDKLMIPPGSDRGTSDVI